MCTNPITIKYIDRVRGGYSRTTVGCNHCLECLKDKQDEWSTRIMQEAARSHGFIFDTFTYNDNSVPVLDATGLDDELLSNMSADSFEYLERNNWLIKYPEYQDIRDIIKRGRELYYRHHGERLKLKYFICSEYGDKKTNNFRPHFHLCVFGVSRATWLEYFSIPWQKRFGFTYPKEIDYLDHRHLCNIARYVGKYCAKGFFEIPLVADGLAPKPFRLVSNGLGVGYLDSLRKQMYVFETYRQHLSFIPDSPRSYYTSLHTDNKYADLLRVFRTNEIWKSLCLFDTSGYPHKLPRYYKDKLFGIEPSVFKTALSSFIQHRAERVYFIELQNFAKANGFRRFKNEWNASKIGNPSAEFSALVDAFNNRTQASKRLKNARLFDKLKIIYLQN